MVVSRTDPVKRVRSSRREVLVGSLLLAGAGLSFARLPRTQVVGLRQGAVADAVPRVVGPWREADAGSFVLPPDDEGNAAAIYDDQLARTYASGSGLSLMLLIAYARSQSSMLMVHRPESCYPGSGFTILANDATMIPLTGNVEVPGRFLTTRNGPRVEQVLYWTRFGNEFAGDWDAQRSAIAIQGLKGLIPDGALVRLSTLSGDAAESLKLLKQFSAQLFASSGPAGRGLLAGPKNRGAGVA